MTNIHYLGLAYIFIWVFIGGFGVVIYRRLKDNDKKLKDLREKLQSITHRS